MLKNRTVYALFSVLLLTAGCQKISGPEERVFFITPVDGEIVQSPVKIKFGIQGMRIAPAGEKIKGAGHHHLIINGNPIPADTIIEADEHHIHYGKGQTETEIVLKPGLYKLTLQFADGMHASYGPALSASVHITVK